MITHKHALLLLLLLFFFLFLKFGAGRRAARVGVGGWEWRVNPYIAVCDGIELRKLSCIGNG